MQSNETSNEPTKPETLEEYIVVQRRVSRRKERQQVMKLVVPIDHRSHKFKEIPPTSSRALAKALGRKHCDVMANIRKAQIPRIETTYVDNRNRVKPEYIIQHFIFRKSTSRAHQEVHHDY